MNKFKAVKITICKIIWGITVMTCALMVFTTISAQANADGLLGYWNFDNIENDIAPDLSGNGFNGYLSDTVIEENGACGKALSFNGQTSRIVVVNFPGFNGNNTLEAWFKMRSIWMPPPYLLGQGGYHFQSEYVITMPNPNLLFSKGGS